VWEALSSPLAAWPPAPGGGGGAPPPRVAPYAGLGRDWARVVGALAAIGAQIDSGDVSRPLLEQDRGFLSAPSRDALVVQLCIAVRVKAGFPNRTDNWGARLCDYYQDLGFGTPENGVLLWAFVKGLVGAHVAADGSLLLLGDRSPPLTAPAPAPWRASAARPTEWPADIETLLVRGLAVRGRPFSVNCAASATQVDCDVAAGW
jgi:hypothetical protein